MINIGLIGCGTVASGVVKLLAMNARDIEMRVGEKIAIKRVCELDFDKARRAGVREEQLTHDFSDLVNDPEIDIIVELIGGTGIAFDFIKSAMEHKKHVVTANKDLVATRWKELFDLSEANGVDFYFEASVGGGIPLIMPMKQSLSANRFHEVMGILNGTTNYILTKMRDDGASYEDVLAAAQALGYAEANPASDVEGKDAARKIAILACLAFNSKVTFDDVYCEGITEVSAEDIAYAKELGYVIKLLAVAKQTEKGIEAYVRPALVHKSHPLASVDDVFNAVFLNADAVDDVMLYGRGAGSMPTASSVVGDIMDICRNMRFGCHGRFGCTCYDEKPVVDILNTRNNFYIRMLVADEASVLASAAGAFSAHNISIASLKQVTAADNQAELVIITHKALENDLRDALAELMQQDYVHRISTMICVEGRR